MATVWEQTILGEPASKSNQRQLVKFGKRPASIKSKKALAYMNSAIQQILPPEKPFEVPVKMECTIYYRTQRPDLDESLVMDALQVGGVVKNDRLIREKHIFHEIDKENPRAHVFITERRKRAR